MAENAFKIGVGEITPSRTSVSVIWFVAGFLLMGSALWFVSALGLDPGNILAQRLDLYHAHLPSAQRFAERPFLDALIDYPAAPLPLFYILGGWLLVLGGSVFTLQLATVGIGLLLLWLIYVQARRNRSFPLAAALALVAAVMISPWFRGTTVYANTDPLPLAFLAAAYVLIDRRGAPWTGTALALACLAVWTRQFYLFGPAAILVREAFGPERNHVLRLLVIGLLMGAPVLAVFAYWGGPTPPEFRHHIASSGPLTTVPVLLSIVGIYMLPLMLATARFHLDTFLAEVRRPVFLVCVALLVIMSCAVVVDIGDLDHAIAGGGAALVGLERLGVPVGVRSVLMALFVVGVGSFITYIVLQAPRVNAVLPLMLLAFVPTTILYQRYFDPMLIMIFGCVLRTRESESLARSWMILLYPIIEMALSIISFYHYGPMLSSVGS